MVGGNLVKLFCEIHVDDVDVLPSVCLCRSVVDPNALNLDPDPGFWLNLDPDPDSDPGPDPWLYYQF